jgi:phage terminase Nu1 subunit (DNA packaging protein)
VFSVTPAGVKGKIVGKAELAKRTGRAVPTVDSWIRRGLPFVSKGGPGKKWEIDTAAAIEWIVQHRATGFRSGPQPAVKIGETSDDDLDLTEERARLAKEQADRIALENAERRGGLIPVDDVVELWAKRIAAARAQLRGVPVQARMSGALPNLTPVEADRLLDIIDAALTELAGDGVPDGSDGELESLESNGADLETAAASNA